MNTVDIEMVTSRHGGYVPKRAPYTFEMGRLRFEASDEFLRGVGLNPLAYERGRMGRLRPPTAGVLRVAADQGQQTEERMSRFDIKLDGKREERDILDIPLHRNPQPIGESRGRAVDELVMALARIIRHHGHDMQEWTVEAQATFDRHRDAAIAAPQRESREEMLRLLELAARMGGDRVMKPEAIARAVLEEHSGRETL